jgi:hypothetical protein
MTNPLIYWSILQKDCRCVQCHSNQLSPPSLAKDIANSSINNMGCSGVGSAPAPTPAVLKNPPFIRLDNSSKAVSTVDLDRTFAMSVGATSSNALVSNSSSNDASNGSIGANGTTPIQHLVGGGLKTTGLTVESEDKGKGGGNEGGLLSPFASSSSGRNDDIATNAEVNKYLFDPFEALHECFFFFENCKSIKCAILFEVETAVRNMDCMKKDKQVKAYYSKYVTFVKEIKDNEFVLDYVCQDILLAYKGSKKSLTRMSLMCKLKSKSADMKKFSYNFPGIIKISNLPSRTMQVVQMK